MHGVAENHVNSVSFLNHINVIFCRCIIVVLKRYEYNVQSTVASKRTDDITIPLRIRLCEGGVANVVRSDEVGEIVAETSAVLTNDLQCSNNLAMKASPEMVDSLHAEREDILSEERVGNSHEKVHEMSSDEGSVASNEERLFSEVCICNNVYHVERRMICTEECTFQ